MCEERPGDFRRPGERRAGLGEHARPQHAVEIDDHELSWRRSPAPSSARRNGRARPGAHAARIAADQRDDAVGIRRQAMNRRFLAFRPLQQPARRAEMRETTRARRRPAPATPSRASAWATSTTWTSAKPSTRSASARLAARTRLRWPPAPRSASAERLHGRLGRDCR